MLGKLRVRKRRAELERTLLEDICQPPGFVEWLGAAKSVRELHESCREPGWLVYCGYWAGVSQDQCMAGATAVAELAAEKIDRSPVSAKLLGELASKDWPEVMEVIVDLERRHPLTTLLIDLLPTQLNLTMSAAGAERLLIRELGPDAQLFGEAHELAIEDRGPYRAPSDLGLTDAEALLAAAFVLHIETLFHRSEGLREALTVRAAASASLLVGQAEALREPFLDCIRDAYRW